MHEAAVLDWGRGFWWDPPKLSVKGTAGPVDLIRLHTSSCSDYHSADDVEDAVEGDDVDSSEMVRTCL